MYCCQVVFVFGNDRNGSLQFVHVDATDFLILNAQIIQSLPLGRVVEVHINSAIPTIRCPLMESEALS